MLNTDISVNDYSLIYSFCERLQLAFILISLDCFILEMNPIAEKLFHDKKQNLTHKNLEEICNKKGLSCPYKLINSQLTPSLISRDTCYELNNKTLIEAHWQLSRYLSDEGNCIGYLLTAKLYHCISTHTIDHDRLSLKRLINSIPGAVYCKDKAGIYMSGNDYLAKISGFSNRKELLRHSDYDMTWYDVADCLRCADQKAISQKNVVVTEEYPVLANHEPSVMLSTKAPLYDDLGNIIGMVGTSVNITHLKKQATSVNPTTPKKVEFSKDGNDFYFTVREIECLQWLIKGKSSTEMAILLNISKRTVEAHLDNIKEKTRCYKQFQLGYFLGKYGALLL